MRAPHSDTIIIKCNGPCMGTSMHMPTRGRQCLGPPRGHPPRPGRRDPPPEPWGSAPPHQPALGRPSGSPARPDCRAPPQQRGVDAKKRDLGDAAAGGSRPLRRLPTCGIARYGGGGEGVCLRGWEGSLPLTWAGSPSRAGERVCGARGAHLAKRQSRARGGRGGRRGGGGGTPGWG